MITYELSFLVGGIILLLFLAVGILLKKNKNTIIIGCLFICYLTLVASITLFPILYDEKIEYYGDYTWYNYIPFSTITSMLKYGFNVTALVQILGNICITIPYGFLIMLFINNKKWWKLLLFSLLLTFSVETLQLTIGIMINNMYRTVDIDDIILNLVGCYIGFIIYKLSPKKIKCFIS